MAIYHLTAKTGSRSGGQSAGAHAGYIARQGRYSRGRLTADEVVHTRSGNMPGWSSEDPMTYWSAADQYERANGRLYRELEFALPKELPEADQVALAERYAAEVVGDDLPYTLAIHAGNGSNPHTHLMFSERAHDGHDRSPKHWFKRAATKSQTPDQGGAPKTERTKPKGWLEQQRERWAQIANEALEAAEVADRIDHRTLVEQCLDHAPELHVGWKATAMEAKGQPTERGQIRREAQADRWWRQWMDRQAGISWSDQRIEAESDNAAAAAYADAAAAAAETSASAERDLDEAIDGLAAAQREVGQAVHQAQDLADRAAQPVVEIRVGDLAAQVREREQEQRRLVERLERVQAEYPGYKGQNRQQWQPRAADEVGGEQWRQFKAERAQVRHQRERAEAEHEAADGAFDRFRGVVGVVQMVAHPVQFWRAGGRLKEAADRADEAQEAMEWVEAVEATWDRWWQRPENVEALRQRTDELVAEDEVAVAEVRHAEEHLGGERQALQTYTRQRQDLDAVPADRVYTGDSIDEVVTQIVAEAQAQKADSERGQEQQEDPGQEPGWLDGDRLRERLEQRRNSRPDRGSAGPGAGPTP